MDVDSGGPVRSLLVLTLLANVALFAQQSPEQLPNGEPPVLKSRSEVSPTQPSTPCPQQLSKTNAGEKALWIVPAGTKIPMQLRQAISTKNAQPGDAIYAQTSFPIVVGEQVMIPAGTYVQGVIDRVKRAGRIKGTAELEFHVKSLLYPNGYTLDMAAAIDQVPEDESSRVKEPDTLKHDSEKGKDVERIGRGAAEGGAVGSMAGAVSGSVRGFGIGGLAGAAAGTMIAVMARGSDLRLENGTVVDVVLNHAIALDPGRILRPATLPAYYPAQPVAAESPRQSTR
jgi:hypothetical protein